MRGIGEPPIGPPPAVASAIEDAIGVGLASVPITPERVLDCLASLLLREEVRVPVWPFGGIIDCLDPASLAGFWAGVLGTRSHSRPGG